MKILEAIRGVSPKVLVPSAVGLVLIVGTVTWLVVRAPGEEGKKIVSKGGSGSPTAQKGEAIDELSIAVPNLDVSVSPLGELGLSEFNLGSDVPVATFGNVAVNDDFSYTGDVSLTTPTVSVAAPTNVNVSQPTAPASPTAPVAPTTPTAPTSPPSGGSSNPPAVSAGTCAQFSGVPSCSYVPDPNGQSLCEQCKAAGF